MLKKGTIGVITVGIFLVLSGSSLFAQFHAPGSLTCSQCHTIHYSEGGAVPTGADAGGPFKHLLTKSSVTDLCLTCHDTAGSNATYSSGGSTPPKVKGTVVNELAGGNFTNSVTTPGKGHSPVGTGFSEATLITAPGGNFTRANETCASCHDPHGDPNTSFTFRNLNKTVNGVTLTATEIGSTNANEAVLVTAGATADQNKSYDSTNHNVYKGEMGKWCGACHSNPDNVGTGFHGIVKTDTDVGDTVDWKRHPTGTNLTAAYATNYGATSIYTYPVVTTAVGALTTAEWSIVAAESSVSCLSCHVAHASGFANATRWDTSVATSSTTGCGKCHGR